MTAILPDKPLIDALPYIDLEYNDPSIQAAVNKEIQSELRTFTKKDYLAHLPTPSLEFMDRPHIKREMDRISRGEPMEAGLDTKRFALEPPSEKQKNDLMAWTSAIANARSQLEHQEARLVNLDLMQKHGANAWRVHNGTLDATVATLTAQVEFSRQEIDEVNNKRKTEQMEAGQKIRRLEGQWYELARKNVEIDAACQNLEKEIEYARKYPQANGQ